MTANKINTLVGIGCGCGILVLIYLFYGLFQDNSSGKWTMGDTVCFKQNGASGTVRWWYYGHPSMNRPPTYKVLSVNSLSQMYEVTVYETDLRDCAATEAK